MKILHCCLAAFYIDNYGYQENILPRMHLLQGHDVRIVASTETYLPNGTLGYLSPSCYETCENIPIARLSYASWLPHFVMRKLRVYRGLSAVLNKFEPDIIFLHDCQFLSIVEVVRFVKIHPNIRIYVDGHTDFINSGRNLISKYILHKIVYRWCAKKIEPYTRKFYGVLPLRSDFFRDIYKIDPQKIEFLPLGVDLTRIDILGRNKIRTATRNRLCIGIDDFVIVTGGKLDRRKRIHVLLKAIDELKLEDVKVIVFGMPTDDMKDEFKKLSSLPNIINVGWIESADTFRYFFAADIAIFPGTHSVLWEESAGLGLPGIFRKWDGMQHMDLGGNCLYFENDDISEIKRKILSVYNHRELLTQMTKIARDLGMKEFSYYDIALRAIEQENNNLNSDS